jgi:hypothetical protein
VGVCTSMLDGANISHTRKFALDITRSRNMTLHLALPPFAIVATVHLPTCEVHR